ncbi:MAG: hypothetical protein AB7S44_03635 [Spirochaetales bacterium]
MSYFNYHAKAKNLIKNGKLLHYEVVEKYNSINPALLLHFESGLIMPIRNYRWEEYFSLIKEVDKNI